MTCKGHNGYFQIQWLLSELFLRPETMHKACGQDNIAGTSIQTYGVMKTFKSKVVDEKWNSNCVRKEI